MLELKLIFRVCHVFSMNNRSLVNRCEHLLAGDKEMDTDEHPRPQTTVGDLAKLPSIFAKGGTVNAGNASVRSSSILRIFFQINTLQKYNYNFNK